ncbi:MAG: pyrroline-5-carboxylate reductase [Planctomycetes bacterium]|nr:pyrroline-5-carboxylate reductase [Planctomycetota bacterium]
MSDSPRFAVLGFGNMGRALVRGVLKAGLTPPENVTVTARTPARLSAAATEFGVQTTSNNRAAVDSADVVVLAIKPQNLEAVADEIRGAVRPDQLVVSILAGKATDAIGALLKDGADDPPLPVIRVMPNIPVMVDAGCSPYARGPHATDEHVKIVEALLGSVGETAEVPEHLMDAVTGLSGSGPAYVYMMIEALTDGGVKMGLPRDVSIKLAAQTIYGAALVVKETGLHPAILRDQVTTPGGTAIAAISDLEENGLRPMLISAVVTATQRSSELSGA